MNRGIQWIEASNESRHPIEASNESRTSNESRHPMNRGIQWIEAASNESRRSMNQGIQWIEAFNESRHPMNRGIQWIEAFNESRHPMNRDIQWIEASSESRHLMNRMNPKNQHPMNQGILWIEASNESRHPMNRDIQWIKTSSESRYPKYMFSFNLLFSIVRVLLNWSKRPSRIPVSQKMTLSMLKVLPCHWTTVGLPDAEKRSLVKCWRGFCCVYNKLFLRFSNDKIEHLRAKFSPSMKDIQSLCFRVCWQMELKYWWWRLRICMAWKGQSAWCWDGCVEWPGGIEGSLVGSGPVRWLRQVCLWWRWQGEM